ncbi:MAG: phytanoyl-CoA dioxygenase family protein [Planctomycetota bacterium]|nr:phytanoyl-CoA dioxygenase family protein [Planctomycetota bacterium]
MTTTQKPAISAADLAFYHDQGYLVLRQAFTPARVKSLVDGVKRVAELGREGKIQVSFLDKEKTLPARLGNILHPDRYQPAFADWLAEDLAPLIEATIGGPARHSLYGMLAAGAGEPYLQGWHRDLGKPGAPDEVEYLKHHHGRFVQFNAPIQPDDHFLHIVPASHLRASTPAEIKAQNRPAFDRQGKTGPLSADELIALEKWDAADAMPGAMIVRMNPGDIAFYNANLWHRGWNAKGLTRWTMHSAFWKPEYPVMAHEHGQREPMLTPGHMARMPRVTREYIQRYLDVYPEGKPKTLYEV